MVDEEQLVAWGREVGATVGRPVFIGLSGPLGAGKSVLARAIGAGAGVEGFMPSPTYTLIQRYALPDGGALWHLDLYRLQDPAEVEELGWGELGAEGEIVLVEWPERAGGYLPEDRWEVRLHPEGARPGLRRLGLVRSGVPVDLPRPVPCRDMPSRHPPMGRPRA